MTATEIRVLERDHRMYEEEVRPFFVEVTNRSGDAWPGGVEQEPRVRLSYHLRTSDGELLQYDGLRSPIPAPLASGETAIVPVVVQAPSAAGSYTVEIDLVHEAVRWFECATLVEVNVVPRR
jgi:hypothetical protein